MFEEKNYLINNLNYMYLKAELKELFFLHQLHIINWPYSLVNRKSINNLSMFKFKN